MISGIQGSTNGKFLKDITVGKASYSTGSVKFKGTTSGTFTETVGAAAGTWTLTWPNSGGTADYAFITDGTGIASWVSGQSIAGLKTSSSPTFTNLTLSGLTANSFVYSGTGGLLTATVAPTNGQLLIGSTGVAPIRAALTGTTNQVTVTNGAGSITLALPQDHHTAAVVQYARLGLGAAADGVALLNLGGSLFTATTFTPVAGTNFNVSLSTTGDFAVNTDQLYVDTSAGNVGIGTTGPNYKLQVDTAVADTGTGTLARFHANGGANPGGTYLQFQATRDDTTAANRWASIAAFDEGGTSRALALQRGGGNVGIGTTVPAATLDVQTSTAGGGAVIRSATGTASDSLVITNTSGSTQLFTEGSAGGFFTGGLAYASGIGSGGAKALELGTNSTVRMIIDSTGNVGIGPAATAPLSKLSLDGGLHVGGMSDAGDNNLLVDGTLIVSGVGPNAVGGGTDARTALSILGSWTGSAATWGVWDSHTLNGNANADIIGWRFGPTPVEAGSGVHGTIAILQIPAVTVTNGVATTTDLVGLDIAVITAATGTTNVTGLRVSMPAGGTTGKNYSIAVPDVLALSHKVSTSVAAATTILTSSQDDSAINTAQFSIVAGTKSGNGGIQFTDLVLWMTNGGTPTVVSSQTRGAADTRTYSISSGTSLQCAMGANIYLVSVSNFKAVAE